MADDRESIRSFVVKELAKSDKPATEAAVAWLVSMIQENRQREQSAEQSRRQERSYPVESEHFGIIGLVAGAVLGWAFFHNPGDLILLGVGAAIIFGIVRHGRSALAAVGWLGIVGFVVGMGGWAWMIYCLGNKGQFSVIAMIVPTLALWALGMFMMTRGVDRQKAKTAARQQ